MCDGQVGQSVERHLIILACKLHKNVSVDGVWLKLLSHSSHCLLPVHGSLVQIVLHFGSLASEQAVSSCPQENSQILSERVARCSGLHLPGTRPVPLLMQIDELGLLVHSRTLSWLTKSSEHCSMNPMQLT